MAVSESLIDRLKLRAAGRKKRIIFPEGGDPRVMDAVRVLKAEGLCEPVLLSGSGGADVEVFADITGAQEWRKKVIATMLGCRARGQDRFQVEKALQNPLLLAAVLLRANYVDGGVAGSLAATADVLRAAIQGVGLSSGVGFMSSSYLMESCGSVFTFGDCVVNPRPSATQLAQIAIDCAQTHRIITGEVPKVGMLSFSTRGSAEHDEIDVVRQALALVRQNAPDLAIDGELQFDAAYVPEVAARKAKDSQVAGRCNVYIFPNLSAGNIAYKIAERMAGARAIGPVLQGLSKPWLDLSRGCGVEDIVNAALLSALLAT